MFKYSLQELALSLGILCFLFSCNSNSSAEKPKKVIAKPKKEVATTVDSNEQEVDESENVRMDLDSLIQVLKPNFGYRFQVEGDFDGDGKTELLTEHYVSQITGKEMNKYFDDLDEYATEVDLATYREPFSFVSSSNPLVKDLEISKAAQLFGLKLLKNEGDLDGDGADELSYVISWADWSSVNYWHIVSYKKGKWVTLYSFEMRDWQTPYLPEYHDENKTFLTANKVSIPLEDTLNLRMEKELLEFEGLVKKVKPGKIAVTCMNQQSDEVTKMVTLKK
jgi:hypothetical protein